MNISKVTDALKTVGLFLLSNMTGILFIAGLVAICYAVFIYSLIFGYAAVGISLIIVALILNNEIEGR